VNDKAHWDTIYRTKQPHGVSWFQREARVSLDLIRRVAPATTSAIIDVGGGASTLADGLLASGYTSLTILDLSTVALEQARARLGRDAARVIWRADDVLTADLPRGAFDVWHDRAVFHFLTSAADRARYVEQARHAVHEGGHALVATFAHDGPTRCSGLSVARYTADALYSQFGAGFRLLESVREEHITPTGIRQAFVYCLCRREAVATPSAA